MVQLSTEAERCRHWVGADPTEIRMRGMALVGANVQPHKCWQKHGGLA